MALYILNAFSLSMLDRDEQRGTPYGYTPKSGDAMATARYPKPCDEPAELVGMWADLECEIISAVGHANTAAVFASILGIPVKANRVNVKLKSGPEGDVALIGQYIGPRLEEGATELPEGARIEWWMV